jgi:hypothetical protein
MLREQKTRGQRFMTSMVLALGFLVTAGWLMK